jgi:flagellar biosynthetic protein FlhB
MIVLGLGVLYIGGSAVGARLMDVMRMFFGSATKLSVTPGNTQNLFEQALLTVGIALLPVLGGLLLIGLASGYAQVGFLFTLEPLMMKWERIDPMAGMKRIFGSQRSMVELLKNLIKMGVIGGIAYVSVNNAIQDAVVLVDTDVPTMFASMIGSSVGIGLKIGLAFLALAALDYAYQRFDYERDLRMTKQELKDESKVTEGDPLIKSRIRGIQRRIAYRRMIAEVPKADVVITNPTHVAVALKYDTGRMSAPVVVAKGADLMAARIKEIAREHHVPVVEDQPLARALYKAVDIGEQIPEQLFHAVAQVLAYIFKLRNAAAGKRVN